MVYVCVLISGVALTFAFDQTILKKLPEDYYNVILMKTYMDFSTYDIAESLGITYENAKKRLSRARKRFKQLLEENDYHAAKP